MIIIEKCKLKILYFNVIFSPSPHVSPAQSIKYSYYNTRTTIHVLQYAYYNTRTTIRVQCACYKTRTTIRVLQYAYYNTRTTIRVLQRNSNRVIIITNVNNISLILIL